MSESGTSKVERRIGEAGCVAPSSEEEEGAEETSVRSGFVTIALIITAAVAAAIGIPVLLLAALN